MNRVLYAAFLRGADGKIAGGNVTKGRNSKGDIKLFDDMFKRIQHPDEEKKTCKKTVQAILIADNCPGPDPIPLGDSHINKDARSCLAATDDCFPGGIADQLVFANWTTEETEQVIPQMLVSENPETIGQGLHFEALDAENLNLTQELTNSLEQSTATHLQGEGMITNGEDIHTIIDESNTVGHYADNNDSVQDATIGEKGYINNAISAVRLSISPHNRDAVKTEMKVLTTPTIPTDTEEVKTVLDEMVNDGVTGDNNSDKNNARMGQHGDTNNSKVRYPLTKGGNGYANINAHKNPESNQHARFDPSIVDVGNLDSNYSFEGKVLDGQGDIKGDYERSIIEQISSAIVKQRGSGKSWELLLKLEPESLGKVMVELTFEGDSMVAKFLASSHETKQIIEANYKQLENALNNQGFNITKMEVLDMDSGLNGMLDKPYDRDNQSSNNREHLPSDDGGQPSVNRIQEGEETIGPYDIMENSSVNYFA